MAVRPAFMLLVVCRKPSVGAEGGQTLYLRQRSMYHRLAASAAGVESPPLRNSAPPPITKVHQKSTPPESPRNPNPQRSLPVKARAAPRKPSASSASEDLFLKPVLPQVKISRNVLQRQAVVLPIGGQMQLPDRVQDVAFAGPSVEILIDRKERLPFRPAAEDCAA